MNDTINSVKTKLAAIQEAIKKNVEIFNSAQANINKLSGAAEAYQDVINGIEKDLSEFYDIYMQDPVEIEGGNVG